LENKVTVRSRSKVDLGTISIDEFIEKVLGEIKDKKSIGE
jgi:threonyl-tRNA synthetase